MTTSTRICGCFVCFILIGIWMCEAAMDSEVEVVAVA